MTTSERIPVDTVVGGEVVAHHRWGVDVRLSPPYAGVTGVIDMIDVTDKRPFEISSDYPAIGSQLEAVVKVYTPNGELRLSTHPADLARVRRSGATGDPSSEPPP